MSLPSETKRPRRPSGGSINPRPFSWEMGLWIGLLVLCNLPFGGVPPAARWGFLTQRVVAGEWWRCLTFSFAHVSSYHLALDASAFLGACLLWRETSPGRRILIVAAGVGGGLAAACTAPGFAGLGLCGLSGPAHGLTALVALETARRAGKDRLVRLAGLAVLATVTAKSLAEMATGGTLMLSLHMGNIGFPNPACHAGGVAGTLLAAWLLPAGLTTVSPSPSCRRAPSAHQPIPA